MGLDSVELLMEVENAFGIELHQQDVAHVYTVEDLQILVMRMLGTVENEQAIYDKLVQLISRQMNIPPERIKPDSSLTKDLGID
ncbi:MAG: hypothetical protein AB7L92_04315 [Alphaproteobacteria bacterium]